MTHEVKKGDWIGCFDNRSRQKPPTNKGLQVISVGKEIRVSITLFSKPSYLRLQPEDVLRVFASKAEADAHMQVAYERWQEGNEKIRQATAQRDAAVMSAIKSGEIHLPTEELALVTDAQGNKSLTVRPIKKDVE